MTDHVTSSGKETPTSSVGSVDSNSPGSSMGTLDVSIDKVKNKFTVSILIKELKLHNVFIILFYNIVFYCNLYLFDSSLLFDLSYRFCKILHRIPKDLRKAGLSRSTFGRLMTFVGGCRGAVQKCTNCIRLFSLCTRFRVQE